MENLGVDSWCIKATAKRFPSLKVRRIDAAGFTIIEVMLVLAIFSIAILGTMSLQTKAVTSNSGARKSNLAMEYMEDTMERLMRIGESDDKFNVDDDGDGATDEADESAGVAWHGMNEFSTVGTQARGGNIPVDNYFSGIYNLTWTVVDIDSDGDGTDDAKQINMTVTWENGSNTLNLTGVRSSVF